MLSEVSEPQVRGFSSNTGGLQVFAHKMATGGGGDDDPSIANVVVTAEHNFGVGKGKKNSKAAASFFVPLSKKAKLAPEAEPTVEVSKDAYVEGEDKDEDFQVLSSIHCSPNPSISLIL